MFIVTLKIPLYYDNILKLHPDVAVSLVEWLLARRLDLEKAEVKEVVVACKELQAKKLGGQTPKPGIFTAFRISLKLNP